MVYKYIYIYHLFVCFCKVKSVRKEFMVKEQGTDLASKLGADMTVRDCRTDVTVRE